VPVQAQLPFDVATMVTNAGGETHRQRPHAGITERPRVAFPTAVYKLNGSGVPTSADLTLTVSFHVRQASGELFAAACRSTLFGGADAERQPWWCRTCMMSWGH
jgi:hypothetical protein